MDSIMYLMGNAPQVKPFIPDISAHELFEFIQQSFFVGEITGWIFAIGIAVFIVSLLLSIVFFTIASISMGNLEMVERSRFWLIFGCIWLGITGLVWGIFQTVILIFSSGY